MRFDWLSDIPRHFQEPFDRDFSIIRRSFFSAYSLHNVHHGKVQEQSKSKLLLLLFTLVHPLHSTLECSSWVKAKVAKIVEMFCDHVILASVKQKEARLSTS